MAQRTTKDKSVVFPIALGKKVSEFSDSEKNQLVLAKKNSKIVLAKVTKAMDAIESIQNALMKAKPNSVLKFEYPNQEGGISEIKFGANEVANARDYIKSSILNLHVLMGRNTSKPRVVEDDEKSIFSGHNGGVVYISDSIRNWLQTGNFPPEIKKRLSNRGSGVSQKMIIEKLLSRLVNIYVRYNNLNETTVKNLSGETNKAWFKPDAALMKAFKGVPFLYKDDNNVYRPPQTDEERSTNAYDRFVDIESRLEKPDFEYIDQGFVRILSSTKSLLRPHQLSVNDVRNFGRELDIDPQLDEQLDHTRMSEDLRDALTSDSEIINRYYEEHHAKQTKA